MFSEWPYWFSSEIFLRQKENKANLRNLCDLLFGMTDLFAFNMIILPLYPNQIDGHVYSVNLLAYSELVLGYQMIYWILFLTLVAIGIIKLLTTRRKSQKATRVTTVISMTINILAVLLLAVTREAYAVVFLFVLLGVKVVLLFQKDC